MIKIPTRPFKPDDLHRILDRYARMCCPVQDEFGRQYRRGLMQTEYSTDLVSRSDAVLSALYGDISRQTVRPGRSLLSPAKK